MAQPKILPQVSKINSANIHKPILSLFVILLIQSFLIEQATSIDSSVGLRENLQEFLQDPIVLDLNSLYKTNKNVKNELGKRFKRSTNDQRLSTASSTQPDGTLVDACQSKMEILTPYYATNSKGKLRTVVNSELMQQAIQVETCSRSPRSDRAKCNAQPECGCEQKYKWHRLLVLDPKDSDDALEHLKVGQTQLQ